MISIITDLNIRLLMFCNHSLLFFSIYLLLNMGKVPNLLSCNNSIVKRGSIRYLSYELVLDRTVKILLKSRLRF